ncbi:MAG: hypothetical protein KJN75_03280 [Muriicola sp.]|nr:hypothetical protein [Muriicola sp.]NNL03210.1 hypothetical protein [Eudoraea sp.]
MYDSFEEIDQQLQILELQRKLDWEHIKLNSQAIKSAVYPAHLSQRIEYMLQQTAITFVLRKLQKYIPRKKQKEIELP